MLFRSGAIKFNYPKCKKFIFFGLCKFPPDFFLEKI